MRELLPPPSPALGSLSPIHATPSQPPPPLSPQHSQQHEQPLRVSRGATPRIVIATATASAPHSSTPPGLSRRITAAGLSPQHARQCRDGSASLDRFLASAAVAQLFHSPIAADPFPPPCKAVAQVEPSPLTSPHQLRPARSLSYSPRVASSSAPAATSPGNAAEHRTDGKTGGGALGTAMREGRERPDGLALTGSRSAAKPSPVRANHNSDQCRSLFQSPPEGHRGAAAASRAPSQQPPDIVETPAYFYGSSVRIRAYHYADSPYFRTLTEQGRQEWLSVAQESRRGGIASLVCRQGGLLEQREGESRAANAETEATDRLNLCLTHALPSTATRPSPLTEEQRDGSPRRASATPLPLSAAREEAAARRPFLADITPERTPAAAAVTPAGNARATLPTSSVSHPSSQTLWASHSRPLADLFSSSPSGRQRMALSRESEETAGAPVKEQREKSHVRTSMRPMPTPQPRRNPSAFRPVCTPEERCGDSPRSEAEHLDSSATAILAAAARQQQQSHREGEAVEGDLPETLTLHHVRRTSSTESAGTNANVQDGNGGRHAHRSGSDGADLSRRPPEALSGVALMRLQEEEEDCRFLLTGECPPASVFARWRDRFLREVEEDAGHSGEGPLLRLRPSVTAAAEGAGTPTSPLSRRCSTRSPPLRHPSAYQRKQPKSPRPSSAATTGTEAEGQLSPSTTSALSSHGRRAEDHSSSRHPQQSDSFGSFHSRSNFDPHFEDMAAGDVDEAGGAPPSAAPTVFSLDEDAEGPTGSGDGEEAVFGGGRSTANRAGSEGGVNAAIPSASSHQSTGGVGEEQEEGEKGDVQWERADAGPSFAPHVRAAVAGKSAAGDSASAHFLHALRVPTPESYVPPAGSERDIRMSLYAVLCEGLAWFQERCRH